MTAAAAATRPAVAGLGAIDADARPALPDMAALLPHLPGHWRDAFEDRGVTGFAPPWERGRGSDASAYLAGVADPLGLSAAIGNCRYGVNLAMSEDMATALATAVNDWMRARWLGADPRLRAAILVAMEDPDRAVEEIERCAVDRRFVQVLLPMTSAMPYGKRRYWPIYAAAARHGLPVAIHGGGCDRHAPTAVGWPTHRIEDVAAWSAAFQGQLASLICEGAFAALPDLRVVLLDCGVAWFAPFLWRLTKFWRGCRSEVPWVDRPPIEIAREHVRMTAGPLDVSRDRDALARLLDQLGGDDLLLWASESGVDVAEALDVAGRRRFARETARALYPRLSEVRP